MTMRLLGLLGLVGFAACGDLTSRPSVVVRDSAGVHIVESRLPDHIIGDLWRISDEPLLEIGTVDRPLERQLFRIAGALRFNDGTVVLANSGTLQLRRVDSHGAYVWAAGTDGDEPGAFRSLDAVYPLGADSIAAFDETLSRFSIFDRRGRFIRGVTVPSAGPGTRYFPIGVARDHDLFVGVQWSFTADPANLRSGRRRISETFVRYSPSEARLDTVGLFRGREQTAIVTTEARSYAPAPFGWGRFQAVRGDQLVIAFTERFQIEVYSGNGVLAEIYRVALAPRPVTETDIERSRAEIIDEMRRNPPPNPVSRRLNEAFVAELAFPATHPLIDALIPDRVGNIWVRHADPDRDSEPRTWSILAANGRWMGIVHLPAGFQPTDIGEDYVLGVALEPGGAQKVQLYELFEP